MYQNCVRCNKPIHGNVELCIPCQNDNWRDKERRDRKVVKPKMQECYYGVYAGLVRCSVCKKLRPVVNSLNQCEDCEKWMVKCLEAMNKEGV